MFGIVNRLNQGLAAAAAALLALLSPVLARPASARADALGFAYGAGDGEVSRNHMDYEHSAISERFYWRADEWFGERFGFDPPGEWYAFAAPSFGWTRHPIHNEEISLGLGLKCALPLGNCVRPYVFGATGPHFTIGRTTGDSTSVNFASYGGGGIEFMISEDASIGVEMTFRHYSNGDLGDPNDGVDSSAWWITYTEYE
ncbi:MAG: acyloxyacyl hydrolase [bacterium]|jgi:hypothetical protein